MCTEPEIETKKKDAMQINNVMDSFDFFGQQKPIPEKILAVEVLKDGVREYVEKRSSYSEKWLFSNDDEYVFSIVRICELLNLDVKSLRDKLLMLLN